MNTQPEALRLADCLTDRNRLDLTCDEAAAELRRLHQSEQEGWRHASELEEERKRLHEANQAMLEALKHGGCPPDCKDGMTDSGGVHPWGEPALIPCPNCAAIAKGEQS